MLLFDLVDFLDVTDFADTTLGVLSASSLLFVLDPTDLADAALVALSGTSDVSVSHALIVINVDAWDLISAESFDLTEDTDIDLTDLSSKSSIIFSFSQAFEMGVFFELHDKVLAGLTTSDLAVLVDIAFSSSTSIGTLDTLLVFDPTDLTEAQDFLDLFDTALVGLSSDIASTEHLDLTD